MTNPTTTLNPERIYVIEEQFYNGSSVNTKPCFTCRSEDLAEHACKYLQSKEIRWYVTYTFISKGLVVLDSLPDLELLAKSGMIDVSAIPKKR